MKNLRHFLTWVLGLVLVFQISEIHAGTNVPVLLWGGGGGVAGSDNNFGNPFEIVSQEDFENIVENFVGRSLKPIVVFVKDDFCTDDFIKHKDSLGPLSKIRSQVYHPSVNEPVSVFEKLSFYNCTNEKDFKSISEGQLVLKQITDFDEVFEKFSTLKESSPKLVAALTGNSCNFGASERIKRATGDETAVAAPSNASTPSILFNGTRILMYASSLPILQVSSDKNITAKMTKGPTQEGEGTGDSPLQLNFEYAVTNGTTTFNAIVLLRFPNKTAGYYTPEVLYKRDDVNFTLATSSDLAFPFNFSYHCSHSIKFGNSTHVRFELTDFQVQIDANNFSDAYDCVGFTSIPIWAGIFVTAILAIIMIWGLTMLMDIRTMDRFDDPKGKTITISASTE